MTIAISAAMSSERPPSLWGVRTPQWAEVTPLERYLLQWPESVTFRSSVEETPSEATTSLVAEINALLHQVGELGVVLESPRRVLEYLLKFPDVIDVVPRAVDGVLRHLPEARLTLDVYRDPEIEDEYLILYVRVQKYDGALIKRIEAAEKQYIDLLAGKKGWFQVTTDFQEPESA